MAIAPNPALYNAPYRHHVNSANAIPYIQSSTILSVLATVVTLFRFISRYQSSMSFGWDDGFIAVTLIFVWAMTATVIIGYGVGIGAHIDQLPLANITKFLKGYFSYELFYVAANFTVKMSIIYFYKRLFSSSGMTKRVLLGIEVFVVATSVSRFLTDLFQCTPVSYFWDRRQGGHCVNQYVYYMVFQVCNIVQEIALYVFPMPVIWRLHMDVARKIGLSFVFLTGGAVIAMAIVRACYIQEILDPDATYVPIASGMWNFLEVYIGTIVASLPTISYLVRVTYARIILVTSRISSFGSKRTTESSSKDSHELGKVKAPSPRKKTSWHEGWSLRAGSYQAHVNSNNEKSAVNTETDLEKGFRKGRINVKKDINVTDSPAG